VEVYINLSDGTGGPLDGTFDTRLILDLEAGTTLVNVEGVAVGDLNEDGDNDIVATSYSNNNVVWFEGNGDGTFQEGKELADAIDGLEGPGDVELVDLNYTDDGDDTNDHLDIVISNYGPTNGSVTYMLGNGDGTFGSVKYIVSPAASIGPAEFGTGNFDNQDGLDKDIDVVVTFALSTEVIAYDNQFEELGLVGGDVPFVAYPVVDDASGYLFNSVSFADVDDTGGLDILISDNSPGSGNPNVKWFSYDDSDMDGNPLITTTWSESSIMTSIAETATATAADFDGVNGNDLIVTNWRVTDLDIVWFESDGAGGFTGGVGTENEYLISAVDSSVWDLEIQDFDNDGDLDIASISYLSAKLSVFLNDRFTLGVDEQSIESIGIYPNPVTNQLNFKGTFNSDLEVSVYDVLGKRIINTSIKFGESLDVSKLNNGLYIIKFEGYNNTFKFVKK